MEFKSLLLELGQNLALVLSLIYIMSFAVQRLQRLREVSRRFILGCFFGTAAICGMLVPIHFGPGVIVDTRSLLVALAALFGGWQAAVVATGLVCIYRYQLGGVGTLAGIVIAAAAGITGLVFRHFAVIRGGIDRSKRWALVALGLTLAVESKLGVFLMPSPLAWQAFRSLAFPTLIFYPTGVWIIGELFLIERQRRATERMLRFTQFGLDHAAEAVFWIDRDAKFVYVNEAARSRLGYEREELLARTIFDLDPDDSTSVWETRRRELRQRGQLDYETTFLTKNREVVPMEVAANLIDFEEQEYICCIAHDITERKKAQEEKEKLEAYLRQTHKMEAIGTLAGGIAHDFNNILSAIIGYAELAMTKVPRDSELAEDLEEIYQAGDRARDLVKQILTFSRQSKHELEPMGVGATIDEALRLLRASLPATIEVRRDIQNDSLIMGDPTQIHQIIMNLCTNSAYAMQERGGVLEVGLTNVELDADFVSGHPDLIPGPYLCLTVSDTGQGMAPEILERVFDPFFTTKETGEGTGMGLSVVHGIVKSYGGAIYVYSETGIGSSFRVFLPAIERRHQPEKRVEVTIPAGNENILFVDDERALASMGKEMLEGLGYHVSTITSSIDALELFRRQPDRFDLVVTDMTMPIMTGDELARELIAVRSDVPIILCTGFSTRITEEKAQKIGIRAFVMKPIIRRDLANTIRNVLAH